MDKVFRTTVLKMRRLTPTGSAITNAEQAFAEFSADRPRAHPERPWVSTNMVMSLDGAFAVDGRSGGLSSAADKAVFAAQRAMSDVILAGASTVRQENYHRLKPAKYAAAAREESGQAPAPTLVIVSRSMQLGDDVPLLSETGPAPLVAHPAGVEFPTALAGLESLPIGPPENTSGVDMAALLQALADRGVSLVTCEGGPHLLGQLASEDLIDEYLLTLSPNLVGGDHTGLLGGLRAGHLQVPGTDASDMAADINQFRLHRSFQGEDHLMLNYRRR